MGNRPSSFHYGSRMHRIMELEVGEVLWIETTAQDYSNVMRSTSARTRWPEWAQQRQYVCKVHRAFGTAVDDPVYVLVRVERLC